MLRVCLMTLWKICENSKKIQESLRMSEAPNRSQASTGTPPWGTGTPPWGSGPPPWLHSERAAPQASSPNFDISQALPGLPLALPKRAPHLPAGPPHTLTSARSSAARLGAGSPLFCLARSSTCRALLAFFSQRSGTMTRSRFSPARCSASVSRAR